MKIEPPIQIELVTFPSAPPEEGLLRRLNAPEAEPPPHLNSLEAIEWRTLRSEKRRREWSAGRLAAKRLVRRQLRELGVDPPLDAIRVARLQSGEPFAIVRRDGKEHRYGLTISHSQGLAVCALMDASRPLRVGVDIERVAPRPASWLEETTHPEERSAALEKEPVLQTALWTLKEAVMKFLGTGMTVGLWDIRFKTNRPLEKLEDLRTATLAFHDRAREAWWSLGRPDILWGTQTLSSPKDLNPLFCLSIAYVPPERSIQLMGGEHHDDT